MLLKSKSQILMGTTWIEVRIRHSSSIPHPNHTHPIFSLTKDVCWFEVPVCDTKLMEEGEGIGHLPHNEASLSLCKPLPLLNVGQQRTCRSGRYQGAEVAWWSHTSIHLLKHQIEPAMIIQLLMSVVQNSCVHVVSENIST